MNRPIRRLLATALLLAVPLVALAAPLPRKEAGVPGLPGGAVVPRTVRLDALPRAVPGEALPIKLKAEGFNPDAEAEIEAQKRNPPVITPAQLGQVTLDSNVGAARAFAPLAPVPGTGFEGITQHGYIPSEPTVAGGPLNVFTAGNVTVTVTDKDGSNRIETDGQVFFGVPTAEGAISDAQCYYDAVRGRFIAVCFTQGTSPTNYSNFYLAISQTNDARGLWYLYKFDMTRDGTSATSNWGDYEGLGVSDDKIAMSAQQFSFSGNQYKYQKLRVIDRALAYAGSPVGYVDFVNIAPPPGGNSNDVFVTKPARNLTAGDATLHLLNVRTSGGTNVTYREVTGPPSAPLLSAGTRVTVGAYSAPPDAAQKGSSTLVATNDCRPGDFYVRNGVLVCAWHTGATLGGTPVSAVRLFRLRCSDLAVLTDETYGAASTFYYYPAATVDSVGTIFLGFDRSSATEYPSSYATGKRRVDAALEPSALLKAGVAATTQSRWGDYTGIDNDAAASGPGGSTAWYAGQWSKAASTFGTWITPLTFTYGQIAGTVLDDCDGSAATTTDRAPLAGVTVTLTQGATTVASTVSGPTGAYAFGWLETGVYDVVVTPPAGGAAVDAVPGSGGNAQTRIGPADVQVDLTNAQTASGQQFLVARSHPVPVATSIAPSTRSVGDPGFTLTVNGSAFERCATVLLDGAPRATAWVSAAQLTATVPASDLVAGGIRRITVANPAPGGGASNPETLTVAGGDLTPPVVVVTAPNGGETWKAGSSHAVTWTASDNVGVTAVDLFLSSDGGATFPDTLASGLANSGTFAWTVLDRPGSAARVRAQARDAAGNSAADTSDASFTIDRWVVTASAGDGGSIAPSGAVGVVQGADAAFTIAPALGHHVADVLADGGSVGRVTAYTFPAVSANHTLAASFALDTLTLVASAGAHGAIAPAGAVAVPWDASQGFTITPDPGYHVLDVLVDGTSVGPVTTYAFTGVRAGHTIAATFSADSYALTLSVSGGGHVDRAPALSAYPYGTAVTLTAVPDSGWAFTGWSGDTTAATDPLALVITRARALTATFADTAPPSVRVLTPIASDVLLPGATAHLSWDARDNAGVTGVEVLLSRAGLAGPFDSIATVAPNTGAYDWVVSGPATVDARLRVRAVDAAGNLGAGTSDTSFVISGALAVDRGPVTEFALSAVWPNPSPGGGRVEFAVPREARVRLGVFDVQGREVAMLADREFAAGRHQIQWEAGRGGRLSAGLYFVRMSVPGRTFVRRVAVLP